MSKFVALLLFVFGLPVIASNEFSKDLNTERQVGFAERIAIIELVRNLSAAARASRQKCGDECSSSGALELAIGLLGVERSDVSAKVLVNLLGARLDGAGSEELSCQLLVRGKDVRRHLKSLSSKQVAEHCSALFGELKKRETASITDVAVDQVCRTESEISRAQNEFLQAIDSGATCEQ